MHRFKSAILLELKNCQNGTFEPLHGIQKKIAKSLPFEELFTKNIPNMSLGPPNAGFRSVRVES